MEKLFTVKTVILQFYESVSGFLRFKQSLQAEVPHFSEAEQHFVKVQSIAIPKVFWCLV